MNIATMHCFGSLSLDEQCIIFSYLNTYELLTLIEPVCKSWFHTCRIEQSMIWHSKQDRLRRTFMNTLVVVVSTREQVLLQLRHLCVPQWSQQQQQQQQQQMNIELLNRLKWMYQITDESELLYWLGFIQRLTIADVRYPGSATALSANVTQSMHIDLILKHPINSSAVLPIGLTFITRKSSSYEFVILFRITFGTDIETNNSILCGQRIMNRVLSDTKDYSTRVSETRAMKRYLLPFEGIKPLDTKRYLLILLNIGQSLNEACDTEKKFANPKILFRPKSFKFNERAIGGIYQQLLYY
jgi:hypothetical protein